MALHEFKAIFWLEASTRLATQSLLHAVSIAKRNGVAIFAGRHIYSTVTVTHPEMYRWLPSDTMRLKITGQVQTAPLIMYNTRFVRDNIMLWYVLCGLQRTCMSPLRARRRCIGLKQRQVLYRSRYMRCHRYDQSALNILLKNAFDFKRILFGTGLRVFFGP